MRPLLAGKAMAACIMTSRRPRTLPSVSPARLQLFLDPNDRFGVFEPLTQPRVFAAKLAEVGVRRLGDHGLGAASQRLQRLERTGIPLAAPIGQGRRIEAFATQDGSDPAGIGGAVGLLQDAQLGVADAPGSQPDGHAGWRAIADHVDAAGGPSLTRPAGAR